MKKADKLVRIMEKMEYSEVPVGARFIPCPHEMDIDDYGMYCFYERDFRADEYIVPQYIKYKDKARYLCDYPYLIYEKFNDDRMVYVEV